MNSVEKIFALLKFRLPLEMNKLSGEDLKTYNMVEHEATIDKILNEISDEEAKRVFYSNLRVLDSVLTYGENKNIDWAINDNVGMHAVMKKEKDKFGYLDSDWGSHDLFVS